MNLVSPHVHGGPTAEAVADPPAGAAVPFAELDMGSLSIEELLVVIQSRVGRRPGGEEPRERTAP